MGHYVYKYVYNNEIIYIGKNDTDLENRIYQHKLEDKFKPYLQSCKIYYIELANRIMSDVIESELIRRYKPKLNVAKMSDWDGLEFKEPNWKLFNPCPKTTERKKSQQNRKNTISTKKQKLLEKYKLMAEYYCPKILENISKAKETNSSYEITIPLRNKTDFHEYCIPLYIEIDNEDVYGGLTLGNCYNDGGENITYMFRKDCIFEEFYGIKPGLIERVQYAQNMFFNKYTEMKMVV